ncbi:DsbA family protein [Microbulbifer sp. 2205BS26-8]|uniref:DsbA family protein n=1 Tax=Microbulbifer sp. 2205BS26-8 TaxID=3064386 RepID=UPI00273F008B|nr:DsbA family protein [Microbulbifer sp. 2205BS26-8]MDP5211080.1 DsbA family protein [Microbulbifer sp. 2205BS26-8]
MTVKKRLVSLFARWYTSDKRRVRNYRRAEKKLLRRRKQGHGYCYLRADDPYSYLLSQVLHEFCEKYALTLHPIIVTQLEDSCYPERQLLAEYAIEDCQRLALAYNIEPPVKRSSFSEKASLVLCEAAQGSQPWEAIAAIFQSLWVTHTAIPAIQSTNILVLQQQLASNNIVMPKRGHYLTAMIEYAGEKYWGLDRLHYLERRLTDGELLFPSPDQNKCTGAADSGKGKVLSCYFSFRSPYSYILLTRLFALADHYQCELDLKPVLPMVMRGLSVPASKRLYILLDAKREANRHNIPFGYISDPLGKGVENALALFYVAKNMGKEREYVLAMTSASWSKAIDISNLKNLRSLCRELALDWPSCENALMSEKWREFAEMNRQEIYEYGLWGVPAMMVDSLVVWGQDRLWMIDQHLSREQ